jgi:hypothetical protein
MSRQITNANTPTGSAQIAGADFSPPPVGVVTTTAPLACSLMGGTSGSGIIEFAASSQYPATLTGYVSPTRPSFNRPLVGQDVVNGVLTVTDTRTYGLTLANGVWTAVQL